MAHKAMAMAGDRSSAGREPAQFPTSHVQRRMLLAEMLRPGDPELNLIGGHLFSGALNEPALKAALRDVTLRHPILRTVYGWDADTNPLQLVLPPEEVDDPLKTATIKSGHTDDWEELAAAAVTDWWGTPFELDRAPPFRARLAEFGRNRHILLTSFHHIAFDEWSWRVFQQDLDSAYQARSNGYAPAWDQISGYQDYVFSERSHISRLAWLDLPFWTAVLNDPPASVFPSAAERSEASTATYSVHVDPRTVRVLTEHPNRVGSLHLALVLCAAAEAFHKVFEVSRIFFTTPFSGRFENRFRSVIGCFVNPVTVPVEYAGSRSFQQRLRDVHKATLGALQHARMPYDEVMRCCVPPGTGNRLGQILVVMHTNSGKRDFERTASLTRTVLLPPYSFQPLVIDVVPFQDGTWVVSARWRTDCLTELQGRSLIEHLVEILRGAARE
jgi:mycobactin peptide synthetase MbtE